MKSHMIYDVEKFNDKLTLYCKVPLEKYDNVDCFYSSLSKKLKHYEINRDEKKVYYVVELPINLNNKKERFFAVKKNGKKERVWKPDLSLNDDNLPEGYFFNTKFLNFTYNPKMQNKFNLFTPVLDSISVDDNKLKIKGYLFLPLDEYYELKKFKLRFIKFRKEEINYEYNINLQEPKDLIFKRFEPKLYEKFNNAKVYEFIKEISVEDIVKHKGFFNFYITYDNKDRLFQNYYATLTKNEFIFPIKSKDNGNISLLNFYYDDIAKVWRMDIYHMSEDEYKKLPNLYNQKKDKKIWLIGEYNRYARDNGMHFYNYMRKNHKEIECYYIIESDSEDIKNLEDKKNIIEYGSFKHFEVASKAKVLVFTHMPNYLIPKINKITKYKKFYKKYYKFFLQHGVIGMKPVNTYHKKKKKYDSFNVSSKFEKNIVMNFLGYSKNEVVINGLPRWDRLYNEKKFTKTILIMPTWRDNLQNVDDKIFIDSDYFKFWNSLLNNKDFLDFLTKNNIKVEFFIHVILNRFIKHFKVDNPLISFKNGENIQDLLLNCGMMITDYSSASFDVTFQNKPVIYTHFDYEHMMELRGDEPYIDYEKDLPGPICKTTDEIIKEIKNTVLNNNWKIDKKYKKRRKKWFKYIDNKNSKRVYKTIKKENNNIYKLFKRIF